jgi:hypothetical protein
LAIPSCCCRETCISCCCCCRVECIIIYLYQAMIVDSPSIYVRSQDKFSTRMTSHTHRTTMETLSLEKEPPTRPIILISI